VRPPGKLGIVDWREDCASCHNCVKRSCVYGLFKDEADTLQREMGYLDYIYQCKGCLNCIQNCTKSILTRVINPEYERLGNDSFTPEMILTTWFQSATGSIPVSGSGYGGPFTGAGFDSMWTDMSEIVRPTRDGIHGREYINTSVDLGRKLRYLTVDGGGLSGDPPPLVESPLPWLFDVVPPLWQRGRIPASIAGAALDIGLLPIVEVSTFPEELSREDERIVPLLGGKNPLEEAESFAAKMMMLPFSEDVLALTASLKKKKPDTVVAIRMDATPEAAGQVSRLAGEGAEVIHLSFGSQGMERGAEEPRHMRDVLRDVHSSLIRSGLRDQLSIVASGGIALPEHVAKAIICGADAVAIDLPLMVAMECRLCMECERCGICPIDIDSMEPDHAVRRMRNLMAAWYNQLIELLGAMGIREARRLRGETGRSMFFEDLERDTFGRLFGKGRADKEAAEDG
jgi:ferredoxin